MCNPKVASTPAQVIEGQYLDQQKLMTLLKDVYGISEEGKNNFRVEVKQKIFSTVPCWHYEHSSDSTGIRYTPRSTPVMPLSPRCLVLDSFPSDNPLMKCSGSDTGLSSVCQTMILTRAKQPEMTKVLWLFKRRLGKHRILSIWSASICWLHFEWSVGVWKLVVLQKS